MYKFELRLTEEQVKEVEKALLDHQKKFYVESLDSEPKKQKEALDKFMAMEDVLSQFNQQMSEHQIG